MKLPFRHDHKIKHIHVWHVTFVVPKDEEKGRPYGVTMNLAVAAESIEDSISTVKTKYPDAIVYAISHGGLFLSK